MPIEQIAQTVARGVAQQGGAQLSRATNSVLNNLQDRLHPANLNHDHASVQLFETGIGKEVVCPHHLGVTTETLLDRAGLTYNAPTIAWLASQHAPELLRILNGFNLDRPGFLKLVKEAQHLPERARIRRIADFVRTRPWINPDLQTLESFRAALPAHGVPGLPELQQALAKVDTRFNRDYTLAPAWVNDAHDWAFTGNNGLAGEEGASYWLKKPDETVYLAKVPPQARRGVNERVGYTLYTALGIKVNQVQYGQRDWLPLLTLHQRLPGDPVTLNRVARDIGLDAADYRLGPWPYPADNIGTGPSTWNRKDAAAYQARVAPHLADPAAFDKLVFAGKLTDDPDLKPGNILAAVAGHGPAGKPIYDIYRIDFGIMMDGYQLRNLAADLQIFQGYLETLARPVNGTHLQNVLPTMKQLASMSDEQLTTDLLRGLHQKGNGEVVELLEPEREQQLRQRLLRKRDLVRAWLEHHPQLAGR